MIYSENLRNTRLNQIARALGSGAVLKIFAGEVHGRCEDADSSLVLAEIDLPPTPFHEPEGGVLTISEPWNGAGARHAGKGTLAHSFRIYDAKGDCHIQGTVTAAEDGGDLVLDNPSIAHGQRISIGGFSFRELE